MEELIKFVNEHWVELVAITAPALILLEKIVRLSPSKKDDIILDMIIKPIFNALKGKK